jgi:hypothetical protein
VPNVSTDSMPLAVTFSDRNTSSAEGSAPGPITPSAAGSEESDRCPRRLVVVHSPVAVAVESRQQVARAG